MRLEKVRRRGVVAERLPQQSLGAALVDGSVRFVSETIDTGDLSQPSPGAESLGANSLRMPSPYGIWGALGSRTGGEPPGEF